jgi:Zn-dependent protease
MAEKRTVYTSFHDIPPRDYMYFPKGTIEPSKPGSFSRTELIHLTISIIVLTIAFSFVLSGNNLLTALNYGFRLNELPYFILLAFVGIITAFFVHEMSHKFMAQKYGLWAEYRMFPKGLGLAFLLGILTPFVFAAPGAVMFMGDSRDFETGRIASAGPLANIILASIMFPIFLMLYETPVKEIIGFICLINAFLATFNLLPFGPLDGVKIIRWNATVWIILLIISSFILIQIWPKLSF